MKLDCEIQTSPAKINTVGVDLEGTNSAGDFGFASSLTYQHRNLFHGSEVFSARFRGAYEALSGAQSQNDGFGNYWEMGVEGSLQLPRFLLPYVSKEFSFAASDDRLQVVAGVLRVYPAAEGDLASAGRAAFSMELTLTLQQEQGAYSETLLVSPSSVSKGSGTTYAWACAIEG